MQNVLIIRLLAHFAGVKNAQVRSEYFRVFTSRLRRNQETGMH